MSFAADSSTPDNPAQTVVATPGAQKSATETPIPVTGSHIPDIVLPDANELGAPVKKSARPTDPASPGEKDATPQPVSAPDAAAPKAEPSANAAPGKVRLLLLTPLHLHLPPLLKAKSLLRPLLPSHRLPAW